MSATKRYLEDLYELAEDAITTELSETINAYFKGDEEEMYEWLNEAIFTDLKSVYSVIFDCKTDLPWNYISLKSDKFLKEVEKHYPELREERLEDGYFFWDEADSAELYKLAADIVEFEKDYDPYNDAFDSDEDAIAETMALITESPESFADVFQERIEELEEEDDEDSITYALRMKEFIGRIRSHDWEYTDSALIAGDIKNYHNEPVETPMVTVTPLPILETLGKGDFRVDIILNTEESTYYAWLYHKDYGIKEMMFGWPMVQSDGSFQSLSVMEELVKGNINSYINSYAEDHMHG